MHAKGRSLVSRITPWKWDRFQFFVVAVFISVIYLVAFAVAGAIVTVVREEWMVDTARIVFAPLRWLLAFVAEIDNRIGG